MPRYYREARPSKLAAYKHYIAERVKAAAPERIPATVLLRELSTFGCAGGYSILKDHPRDAEAGGQAGAADPVSRPSQGAG